MPPRPLVDNLIVVKLERCSLQLQGRKKCGSTAQALRRALIRPDRTFGGRIREIFFRPSCEARWAVFVWDCAAAAVAPGTSGSTPEGGQG